ncbi:GNAT family N-acetyltransferase [Microcella sp.]|uniref:GNAT family N-acetyltransferase n=1 Tax=Microcella sp. TaxID=1913979 RepID=UPI00256B17B0|nr:GNAT family protein [Microcella sp.]MBX9471603.1 GNAT family N-acetyltransferase [Microcella sp.]
MASIIPTLRDGATVLRPIRVRDARELERELLASRAWLRPWEATSPSAPMNWDTKGSIRSLLAGARAGTGLPFVIETDGRLAGQLNVSGMTYGSLASATIGYWVGAGFAGRGLTPAAVALATDHVFFTTGLHRMEICIRPENTPSLRVVEKLGFRYEGLRRRYIHINGDWRDHFCFGLTVEEVPQGVLQRWKSGRVDPTAAEVPEVDRIAARHSIPLPPPR